MNLCDGESVIDKYTLNSNYLVGYEFIERVADQAFLLTKLVTTTHCNRNFN